MAPTHVKYYWILGYREGAGVCARGQAAVESLPMTTQWPCEGGVVRTGNGGRKTADTFADATITRAAINKATR